MEDKEAGAGWVSEGTHLPPVNPIALQNDRQLQRAPGITISFEGFHPTRIIRHVFNFELHRRLRYSEQNGKTSQAAARDKANGFGEVSSGMR